MSNTSTRVFKSLPDSSLVVSLSKDEFIDKFPNNYFIDEGEYLSSLKVQF